MDGLETDKKPTRDENGQFIAGTAPGPGRPSGSVSLTAIIKKRLQELDIDQKRKIVERMADSFIRDALAGRNGMGKLIWAYIDGKPKDSSEPTSELPPTPIMSCNHLNCLDCSTQARADFINASNNYD